ncbi:uncharacterized protein LTR77_006772 [Saxophila tyrrhenica]|uniref:Uncharacterized protein n=1 Tax=Saxophila tyrrhenica TaxID=1690608 RepID=A0AAV9P9J2_9PEZI|nr:hypothetical protein LTR77_006772 [Saxophila tyrrhenica]
MSATGRPTVDERSAPGGIALTRDTTSDSSRDAEKSPETVSADSLDLDQLPPTAQYGAVFPHVFSHPDREQHWREVFERSQYEGRHRFDPSFSWTGQTLDLVRRNINRAISDNMLDDIGVNTNDYNTGQTIYFICFLFAELPGGLISKKIGPYRYTPAAIVLWGAFCAAQAGIKGRASFWALRAVLGFCQGGFIPEMVLYLSYFYKGNELPIRLSIFWTAIPLTQIYGSLMAAGLLEMRGVQDWAGWQWLFLVEGLICVVVGLISFLVMPGSVCEPALAFKRKDGSNKWWSENEEKVLVNRILRDDPTKGDMNSREGIDWRGLWSAFTNIDLWPIYILGISAYIPFQPTANYLSLILRNMGYSVFMSNILAIPGFALFAINILVFGKLSEKLDERCLVASGSNLWMLPFFIGLIAIPDTASPWVRYVLLTGVNGIPYTHSILVGMTSRNAKSVATRTVSAAVYNMCYQVGSIIAVNVYREEDMPYYYTGNRAMTALCVVNIALFVAAKFFYIWRNKVAMRKFAGLPESEKSKAVAVLFAH